MFNFIKKAGTSTITSSTASTSNHCSSNNQQLNDDKEKCKRDKKERKDKQKRERANMSTEELLRLDEVRRSLKIRTGKRNKEKLPSGITADYTADFLANLIEPTTTQQQQHNYQTQSDSSETSLNSFHKSPPPTLPPKPPKRGILKQTSNSGATTRILSNDVISSNGGHDTIDYLVQNTIQNELITYQNLPTMENGKHFDSQLFITTTTTTNTSSPSIDSLTDTTNSSFATPPFSTSPIGESQGYQKFTTNFENNNDFVVPLLPLPDLMPIELPKPRILKIARQRAPRNDFGFSLRRAMIIERIHCNFTIKAVIFAEPGAIVQHNNETGLLPGDKLLQVNNISVENKSREDIIDMIKASGDYVVLKVQPVAELCELSRRSGHDGNEVILDDLNIKGGTLKRSGSRRFNKSSKAKSDNDLEKEKKWLDTELVWLMHRNGFTLAKKETSIDNNCITGCSSGNKIKIKLEQTGDVLYVDEDDIEMANPLEFNHIEDLSQLRHLNESSILNVLRQRYAMNLIHTYAGYDNLLIVNPMAPLAIYSEKVVALFKGCKSEDMPPHIYSITQSSYHSMLQTRRDQSIVFMGRSGSGKTTNFRHSVQYLVTIGTANCCSNTRITTEKLTALWTLLENFGNCKTILNSNATRFTQLCNLNFDQSGILQSLQLQIYLFDKTRINCGNGESTFHVIEQLRNAINMENCTKNDLLLETLLNEFKIKQSMNCLNFTMEEQRFLLQLLLVVMQLKMIGCQKINNRLQFTNMKLVQNITQLLGITIDELNHLIFQQEKNCTEFDGLEAICNFTFNLYQELFYLIVNLVNRFFMNSVNNCTNSIILMDCPGFQNSGTCGRQLGATFEDLLINYLNERVQLLYYTSNLQQPKERYLQENVFIDNNTNSDDTTSSVIVDLFDKNDNFYDLNNDKCGLFWLLNDLTNGEDAIFLERLFTNFNQRNYQFVLKKAGINQFVVQHFNGTNPVLYCCKNWLKSNSRDGSLAKNSINLLQESCRDDLSKFLIGARNLGNSMNTFSGSLLNLDGSQSLRRASSIRRTINGGNVGIKRKSVCLQTKFVIDVLIETLRRTKIRFVHCMLPQHNAGHCDINNPLLNVKTSKNINGTSQCDDGLINIPLLRSQLRGSQILEAVRLYKQGYPNFLPLNEFRRRFRLLANNNDKSPILNNSPILDERKAVEDMLLTLDLDLSNYRLGLSQIFFRNGVLSQLESQRDERLCGMVINLQAHCRGYLSRKLLDKLKLQDLAVRCIQKNVRKFLLVRNWPWWRLLIRVTPLLNVHRTEEELRRKNDELESLKVKLEKLENERTTLKYENDKLEAKMSEMSADLAEEHSTSTLTMERLNVEQMERLKLEKELSEYQHKNKELQQQSERLEMELLYAKSDLIINDDNDDFNDDDDDDNNKDNNNIYKQRYERAIRELEFVKRRLQQQHEDDLEQLIGLKKQLEKKLTDAYEEVEEQRQVVGQWKRKFHKLSNEMNDLRLLLEEQNARNNLLEKKQRKFDIETTQLNDELKKDKQQKERLLCEKNLLINEKFTIEQQLNDLHLEYDLINEKYEILQKDYDEITCDGKTDEEITQLKKQKIDFERRLNEQDEELDELAGQVQLLEQAKLRLEMTLESMRKDAKKEVQQRDEELEEVRCSFQKKLKCLEQQLENEHEERTQLLREKHELERRLMQMQEQERQSQCMDEQLVQRLKRDLKRTKVLLRDQQQQLDNKQKSDIPTNCKLQIRQLKNQLEDVECNRQLLMKTKQNLEDELLEQQQQTEDLMKLNKEFELKLTNLMREKNDLQIQFEENEEELNDVLKKYKQNVQQMSLDQNALQDNVLLVNELEMEKLELKEQINELQMKLAQFEQNDNQQSNLLMKRNELKLKDFESKLELEQTQRNRLEIQQQRYKDTIEKLQNDLLLLHAKEQQQQDFCKKLQKQLKETKEELNKLIGKDNENVLKRKDMEKEFELLQNELKIVRNDLKLALKRIEDLQNVIQGDLDDNNSILSDQSVNEDSEDVYESSDESFVANDGRTAAVAATVVSGTTSSSRDGKNVSYA